MKLGDDGFTLGEGWQSELEEGLREDKTLAEIKDIPSMAKMLVSAQKMVGADKLVVPDENAGPEEWDKFHTALGRPKSPDEYPIEVPEDYPSELVASDEVRKEFRNTAHKLGLNSNQAKGLFDWYGEVSKAAFNEANANRSAELENSEKELKQIWGDKYNENLKSARDATRAFLDEEGIKHLDETGLGNAPWLIKAFHKIGEVIGEEGISKGSGPSSGVDAQAEIDRIMGDLNHPYHNKKAPGHVEAVHRMQELYQIRYPKSNKVG